MLRGAIQNKTSVGSRCGSTVGAYRQALKRDETANEGGLIRRLPRLLTGAGILVVNLTAG